MDDAARNQIKSLIKSRIDEKLQNYESETDYKPFFEAIFDKSTIIQASIMQSLYTSFGMSIYEQIAVILAREAGNHGERQYLILGTIDDDTRVLIDRICDQPIGTTTKQEEVELIRESIKPGSPVKHPDSTADVYLKNSRSEEIFIDITTAKPNKKESRALRRKFLVWTALRLSQDKQAKVHTYMGIPYNPYYPNQYNRSFVVNNCHGEEVFVQDGLWELFAGYDVFSELLEVFQEIGSEMKHQLELFFEDHK